jgi:exopolysaccharide production protein ExoF
MSEPRRARPARPDRSRDSHGTLAEVVLRRGSGSLLALAIALLGAGAGAAQDYPVGPSDLLRLRVLDWDPLEGAVVEWPEVSGEYTVGPDGSITVPFAGRVESAGRRTDEIAADVVEGLRNRLALVEPPDATVEVAAWRPVIVTGDVRSPGPYDFTPGLLAAQAVGLAGGTQSPLGNDASLRREVAFQQTTLATLRSGEQRQVARRARLEAELAGEDGFTVAPPSRDADWPSILALEEQLLRIRRDRLARELAAIDEQAQLYVAEIESLERKQVTLNEQLALAEQAATNAEDLASQGLVANQRLFESGQARANIENQLLDVSTAILTARQNIASADRERISLQDARTAEILEERQELDGELAETRARIAGQLAILQALEAGELVDVEPEPEVAVLRAEGGELLRIEDAALEPLRPGDMVEVTQPTLFGPGSAADPAGEASPLLSGVPGPGAAEPASLPAPEPLPLADPTPVEAGASPEPGAGGQAPADGGALGASSEAGVPEAGLGFDPGTEPVPADAGSPEAATEPAVVAQPSAVTEIGPRRQPMISPPSVSPVSRPG